MLKLPCPTYILRLYSSNVSCLRFCMPKANFRACIRFRNSDAFDHGNLKRYRLIKLCFSTFLFGGTFVTVLLWKRKQKTHLKEIFKDCLPLSKNPHFQKNVSLFSYKDFILPDFVIKEMNLIRDFQVRDDDIYVVSFPKTGTTWLQEIVYLIVSDLDFETAKDNNIEERFPYLEFIYPGIKSVEKMSSQRFIKTHLPYSLLPPDVLNKKPKIFYIVRNPKDVIVSYYHFVRMMTITNYTGTFLDFFNDFLANKVPYGPLWRHYCEFWDHRNDDNIFFVHYEDMHKDVHDVIRKIADFLGKSLTDEEVEKIAEYCSFKNMAVNPAVNYQHWDELGIRKKEEERFMRKGIIGDWKNYFSADMDKEMGVWLSHHLGHSGIYSHFSD